MDKHKTPEENQDLVRKTDAQGHPITHNLDTGENEPLDESYPDPDRDKNSFMDFGDGSGGGSATDGAAA